MNAAITYGDPRWSLGVLIGLPILAILILAFAALTVLAARAESDRYGDIWGSPFPRKFVIGFFGVLAAVVAIIATVGFYPYSAQYHQYVPVTGAVASTSSRFLAASGGGSNQKFVVTFAGSDQQYGCNDTRCAGLHKGDSLTITCKRTFQWFGTPGYDCNFVSLRPVS